MKRMVWGFGFTVLLGAGLATTAGPADAAMCGPGRGSAVHACQVPNGNNGNSNKSNSGNSGNNGNSNKSNNGNTGNNGNSNKSNNGNNGQGNNGNNKIPPGQAKKVENQQPQNQPTPQPQNDKPKAPASQSGGKSNSNSNTPAQPPSKAPAGKLGGTNLGDTGTKSYIAPLPAKPNAPASKPLSVDAGAKPLSRTALTPTEIVKKTVVVQKAINNAIIVKQVESAVLDAWSARD